MENSNREFEELLLEFNQYKRENEEKLSTLKAENERLGKSLAVFFNIVEISGYVNSFISKDNLMVLINDMIIGVLGAAKSTIYILEGDKFVIKAANDMDNCTMACNKCEEYMNSGQACIINIEEDKVRECNINSILGIPICIGANTIGYIVAEHTLVNFFSDEHKVFLGAIANQIAIAIENARLYKEIQRAAEVDPLLGIYNRRTFFYKIDKKLKNKKHKEYAIVMVDLDDFKCVNDTFGHQVGDEVLLQTTNVIQRYLNKDDVIGRYGGEELIIYLANVKSADHIYDKVDKIRKGIELNVIAIGDKAIKITSSFGISFSSEEINTLANNIQIADSLLYKAKNSGKNRIISSYNML